MLNLEKKKKTYFHKIYHFYYRVFHVNMIFRIEFIYNYNIIF